MRFRAIFLGTTFLASVAFGELSEPTAKLTIARLRYSGGGDWYNDPDVIPNLLAYIREHTNILTAEDEARVGIMDPELFSYPILYMTGHGNINFSEEEARRLREYLVHGGFLYADDDYGMDKAFRREMKKVFPDEELVELPYDYGLFHCHYDFPEGAPKVHEHYPGPPRTYGIFHNGRLVVLYTYNSNVSDGWTPSHNDPPKVREEALKFGVNIVVWALMQ